MKEYPKLQVTDYSNTAEYFLKCLVYNVLDDTIELITHMKHLYLIYNS